MNEVTMPGLIVPLEARIDKLEKGLKRANVAQKRASTEMERRAKQSADRISASYDKVGNAAALAFKRIIIPAVVIDQVAKVGKATRQAVGDVARLGDEAKRAGVSVKALQEWSYVGSQNRIGIDQMVDGLKELQLRADEFVITGKGSGAEAFARLGYSAEQLKEELKNPSELLLEIIGRMEQLDDAARIRIADEIFGGSAGERFVELVGRGESALRATIKTANETGAVLEDSVIAKAQELDRRFAALQTRVGNFFKGLAVSAADAAVKIATLRTDIDDLFESYDQARGLLGDGVADTLSKDSDAVDEHRAKIQQLRIQYERLSDYANSQSSALMQATNLLRAFGETEIAGQLSAAAIEMQSLTSELADGTITADEFEKRMGALATGALAALNEIEAVDRAEFSNVIAGIGGLIKRLGEATAKARELRSSLPGVPVDGGTDSLAYSGRGGDPRSMGGGFNGWAVSSATELAPKTSPRPRAAPNDIDFDLPPEPAGGGGKSQSAFEREIESIAQETAALRLEAQALAEATGARLAHGDALQLAATKADLLGAAMRSGMADTPALRAQIDALANQYVEAADAADLAADRIADVQNASRAGAQAVTDVFTGMATGAMSAKEAVGQLIVQMLKLSFQKRMLEMAQNSSGWLGNVFKFLGGGFAEGGWTGPGGKYKPAGVVHKSEFVFSKEATSRIGVGNLEALHSAAKRGFASGGYVGGAPPLGGPSVARFQPVADPGQVITINAPVTVNGSAGTPEQNTDLANRMARQMEATMRGVVVDELRKQGRPGNMLNSRRR